MSNKNEKKTLAPEDDNLSLMDCSILDSSNGEKLALYLRRKRGMTKNARLFGNYAAGGKSPRSSFPIEIIPKSSDADVPNTSAQSRKEVPAEYLPEESEKINLVGRSPRRSLVVSLKRMSHKSLSRKTLLKEFEKTVQDNDFNPPVSSTPIMLISSKQLGQVSAGISCIPNATFKSTPETIQNCAKPQNEMLNINKSDSNSASSSQREVCSESNKVLQEQAPSNTTKAATTQTTKSPIKKSNRRIHRVPLDSNNHFMPNNNASQKKPDGIQKKVFSPTKNIQVSYHSINKPEVQYSNDDVVKSVAKTPEKSAKRVTESDSDMLSKQPVIVIPINQTFYSQSPNKTGTTTDKVPTAVGPSNSKSSDTIRNKENRSSNMQLELSDDQDNISPENKRKKTISKRVSTDSAYEFTSDDEVKNMNPKTKIDDNRPQQQKKQKNKRKSSISHRKTGKKYELTSDDDDDEHNFQNNNDSSHRRLHSKQVNNHQVHRKSIPLRNAITSSRNSDPLDLRLNKENSQKSNLIQGEEVSSDDTIPETQPITDNDKAQQSTSIVIDHQTQSKTLESRRYSNKSKNSGVYCFNTESSSSSASSSSEDSLLNEFDENLIQRADYSDFENVITDRSPRSQQLWADSIFKSRSMKSKKPRLVKRGKRVVSKVSDPLTVTMLDIESALQNSINKTSNNTRKRRKLYSQALMESMEEHCSEESTLRRDKINENAQNSISVNNQEERMDPTLLLKDKQYHQEDETPRLPAAAIKLSSCRSLIQTIENILDEDDDTENRNNISSRTIDEIDSTTKNSDSNLFKIPLKPAPKSMKKFMNARADVTDNISTTSNDNVETALFDDNVEKDTVNNIIKDSAKQDQQKNSMELSNSGAPKRRKGRPKRNKQLNCDKPSSPKKAKINNVINTNSAQSEVSDSVSSENSTLRKSHRKRTVPVAYWTNTKDQMLSVLQPLYKESPPHKTFGECLRSRKLISIKKAIVKERERMHQSSQTKKKENSKAVAKKNRSKNQTDLERNNENNFVNNAPLETLIEEQHVPLPTIDEEQASTSQNTITQSPKKKLKKSNKSSQTKKKDNSKAVEKKTRSKTQTDLERNEENNFVNDAPLETLIEEQDVPLETLIEEQGVPLPTIDEQQPSTSQNTITQSPKKNSKKKLKKSNKSNISEETNRTKTDSRVKNLTSKMATQPIQEEESIALPITETPTISKAAAKANENKRVANQTSAINDSGNATATVTISQCAQTDITNHTWMQKLLTPNKSTNSDVSKIYAGKVCVIPSAASLSSTKNLKFEDIDGVEYAFYATKDDEKNGYMRFKPHSAKKTSKSKQYQLQFLNMEGSVKITIGDMTFDMVEGDLLTVEKGVRYKITNPTDNFALIFFNKF